MDRTITVERLYTLGDYQNIKFTSTISSIPEEISNDDKAVSLLFLRGGLECDIAYSEYMRRREALKAEKVVDVLTRLKEEREQASQELNDFYPHDEATNNRRK